MFSMSKNLKNEQFSVYLNAAFIDCFADFRSNHFFGEHGTSGSEHSFILIMVLLVIAATDKSEIKS